MRALSSRVAIINSSSIYHTEPWGYQDQPPFLNQVLEVKTDLSPLDLLAFLKKIEQEIGRKPSFRFGPRLVDIDILLYGQEIIKRQELVVPHQRLKDRAFVLVPLAEIAPLVTYPGSNQTISELVEKVDCSGVEVYQETNG
jgi:2-amino-4-hydroxy-6-hydroxymethyldihydropteridine diphosphokinase